MGIEGKNIRFEVDTFRILNNVSFAFQEGFIGIIGPNGAGKTTLLRMISGYQKPTGGSILLDSVDILHVDIRTRAQKMALVPQNYAMEYDFTVLETVLMGRNPHKKIFELDTKEDYDLATECICKAGIEHLKNRSVLGLSGGEWQRMIIARALCQQSRILLLDEPVSSLDIKHQVGILDMVWELTRKNGLIAVCVLHDLNLTYNYCDRVLLMQEGGIFADGSPENVLTKENVEEVYGARVEILRNGNSVYVLPVMLEHKTR
ncbi:MAG: ABC transporter ATP-binding protein [Eubacteriales bacterium]